ncbi:MAG: aminotransferase class I/II-fold pyridoxal phosphate-dependent enzyme [Candidatus Actinomarinales bacterium]|nr:aminotransferase class I/II-fold pyridoxal phosphate-dependent enzyme [Candidatus Actinomarinales bacterium]|tara:strand:+ start:55 stop:1077 length:1023 start_codon:yes stop_codon:yes gene_type:complete
MIDLRSDTVTKPDKDILEEALNAELGDDEYGEDPTVNQLQEKCSNLLGFEEALFVSSGLMGNQISLLIHNTPGSEVITTSDSHIKNYEHGAASFLSRVQFREVEHANGVIDLGEIATTFEKSKVHKPNIKTIALENTHLASGGSIVPFNHIKNIYELSKQLNVSLHIDGARVWHAILQEDSSLNYGSICDSLTFCFSKALGAPIGSMLLGSREFIKEAREYRKILGGGTRQVGVIASMASKALDKRERLLEDHTKAENVYKALLDNHKNNEFNLKYQNTNMVFLEFKNNENASQFIERLQNQQVLSGLINKNTVRLVFHKDILIKDLETIKEAIYSSSKS